MKLGLIAPVDVTKDKNFFSGTGHALFCSLNERVEIVPLIVHLRRPPVTQRLHIQVRRRLTGKKYNLDLHPWTVRDQSVQGMRLAEQAGVDVVLAFGQSTLARWDSKIPAAFFSDTLYGAKFNTHGPWKVSRMDLLQLQQLQEMGQQAIDHAVAVFLTNQYSFDRAVEFGTIIPPEKQIVTYIGPNMILPDSFLSPPSPPPLRLLWVGTNWELKGGADCVAVADALIAAGLPVELHMVGRKTQELSRPYLTYYGYLHKEVEAELQQLLYLYQTCHFLVLPTQGDMSPAGLAEAAAMGLPAVTTTVGGIPEFFPNGEAILIAPDRFRHEAPAVIQEAIAGGAMAAMRHKMRQRYEEVLNYNAVADKIVNKLESVLTSV